MSRASEPDRRPSVPSRNRRCRVPALRPSSSTFPAGGVLEPAHRDASAARGTPSPVAGRDAASRAAPRPPARAGAWPRGAFSSRCPSEAVPGIGSEHRRALEEPGERHLSRRRAVSRCHGRESALLPCRKPFASGAHGDEGNAELRQRSTTALRAALGKAVAVLDGDDGAAFRARSSSSSSTLQTPTSRILPSRCSSNRAPRDSSSGTAGSTTWSWKRPMRSTWSRRRLPSHASRRRSGRASAAQRPGGRPHEAGLRRHENVVRVGSQRLRDQLLAHSGPVRVGRVDELDAQLHRAVQHPASLAGISRHSPYARAGQRHGAEAQPADGGSTHRTRSGLTRCGTRRRRSPAPAGGGRRSGRRSGQATTRRPRSAGESGGRADGDPGRRGSAGRSARAGRERSSEWEPREHALVEALLLHRAAAGEAEREPALLVADVRERLAVVVVDGVETGVEDERDAGLEGIRAEDAVLAAVARREANGKSSWHRHAVRRDETDGSRLAAGKYGVSICRCATHPHGVRGANVRAQPTTAPGKSATARRRPSPQPGAGTASESRKQTTSPLAASQPALRAPPARAPPPVATTEAPCASAIAGVASVDPSSTRMTSSGGTLWPARAVSTVPIVRAALRAGITTLTELDGATMFAFGG